MIAKQMKIKHRKGDGQEKYWISINGGSCAISLTCAMVEPRNVSPTPNQLFGFPTREEAVRAQKICLESPIPAVEEEMAKWVKRADVSILWPANPEPPTSGPTLWSLK